MIIREKDLNEQPVFGSIIVAIFEIKLTCVKSLMGSKLARLNERLVTAWMGASVWPLAGVYSLVGLKRLFPWKGSLTETTSDGTLRVGALLDERGNFFKLGPAPFL